MTNRLNNLLSKARKQSFGSPARCTLFLATCAILVLFFSACSTEPSPRRLAQQRDRADSIVGCVKGEQSLDSLVKEAEKSGDNMLEMRARRQLGRTYREDNFFMKAIDCHQREMALGEQLHDTIAMAQALNNIGTNYRRMGILDEAINYHYRALHISEEFSYKDDRTARKNRVVSLNGIGNICLTLGDKETADSVFHAALEGEKSLGSNLGQAINYANIGSIFEQSNRLDSAWVYYRHSMEQNRLAESDLGISLCYTHFGRLYDKQGKTAEAITEYRKAYEIMKPSGDRWHTMEPCLALAEIHLKTGDYNAAMHYLEIADQLAHDLHSLEHQSQIARIYYEIYSRKGDYARALRYYKEYNELGDSVASEKNIIHMQNMRMRYENGSTAPRWMPSTTSTRQSARFDGSASPQPCLSSCLPRSLFRSCSTPCVPVSASSCCSIRWTRCASRSSPISPTSSARRSPSSSAIRTCLRRERCLRVTSVRWEAWCRDRARDCFRSSTSCSTYRR